MKQPSNFIWRGLQLLGLSSVVLLAACERPPMDSVQHRPTAPRPVRSTSTSKCWVI